MKMRAEVVCVYGDERTSKTVAAAVSPDNLQVPEGLVVSAVQKGRRVVSVVKLEGRAETLLATLDDLLACMLTAENML